MNIGYGDDADPSGETYSAPTCATGVRHKSWRRDRPPCISRPNGSVAKTYACTMPRLRGSRIFRFASITQRAFSPDDFDSFFFFYSNANRGRVPTLIFSRSKGSRKRLRGRAPSYAYGVPYRCAVRVLSVGQRFGSSPAVVVCARTVCSMYDLYSRNTDRRHDPAPYAISQQCRTRPIRAYLSRSNERTRINC